MVAAEELEPGDDAGFKLEIEHAKEPDFFYRIYPLGSDLTVSTWAGEESAWCSV